MLRMMENTQIEPYCGTPLVLEWDSVLRPLPIADIQPPPPKFLSWGTDAPPWIHSGPPGEAFDFSQQLRDLCEDISAWSKPLRHLDVSRILFSFTPARNLHSHGLQARVTPLRFRHGELRKLHRGVPYQVQRFRHDGKEILYIITFCLPRFLNRTFEDKFVTIFHELFHICPSFNGDLRRHEGRYSMHTASQKRYDREMLALAREYISKGGNPMKYGFLRLNYSQLFRRHGRMVGNRIPRPKVIPLMRFPQPV